MKKEEKGSNKKEERISNEGQ